MGPILTEKRSDNQFDLTHSTLVRSSDFTQAVLPTDFRSNPNTQGAASQDLHDLALDELTAARTFSHLPYARLLGATNELFQAALATIAESSNHPFHGVNHAFETSETFETLIAHLEHPISQFDEMLGLLACGAHDLGHCGFRYRQLANTGEDLPRSNEEFAAFKIDALLAEHPELCKIGATGRLRIQGGILATSVGQLKPPSPELYRPYKPHSRLEVLVFMSDRLRFINSVERHLAASLKFAKELPETERPRSYSDWLSAEIEYVEYLTGLTERYQDWFTEDGKELISSSVAKLQGEMRNAATPNHRRARALEQALTRLLG